MVKMKTTKCPTCGGMVFKLAGAAAKLCHDECVDCRRARDEDHRQFHQREMEDADRRQLENEEMANHFNKNPHG